MRGSSGRAPHVLREFALQARTLLVMFPSALIFRWFARFCRLTDPTKSGSTSMRALLQSAWSRALVLAMFVLIILAFVFFFGPQTSGYQPGTARWIAKVDGRPILNIAIDASAERYRRRTGQSGRLSDQEFADFRRRLVINDAVVELLAVRAEEAGMAVSYNEVRCYIVNWHRGYMVDGVPICAGFPENYAEVYPNLDIGFYQDQEGNFSDSYASDVRANFRVSDLDYEDRKGSELLALRYLDTVAATIDVPPAMVLSTFERRNTKVVLDVAILDPSSAIGTPPTDVEVEAFLLVNAAAVQTAYAANTEDYAVERQVRIRRLQIRKPDASNTVAVEEATARYAAALARAEGDESFESVVRELTELDNERATGGDMGLQTRSTLSEQIYAATETMAVGDVQGVEQQFAWSIIKLEELEEARTLPLAEVQSDIARELLVTQREDSARAALRSRGERLLALAAGEETLAAAAELEVGEQNDAARVAARALAPEDVADEDLEFSRTTPLLTRQSQPFARETESPFIADLGPEFQGMIFPPSPADEVPGVGTSREMVRTAFTLTAESPLHGEIIESDGVLYIIRLAERTDAPTDVPAGDYTRIYEQLRANMAESVVGSRSARNMLLADVPAELSPFLQQLVDEAIAQGRIELRDGAFEVDPAAEI